MNPDLANTLERIAKVGADDFYNGEIARKIAADIASNGGLKQDPLSGELLTGEKCGFLEVDKNSGELNPDEFAEAMLDLTNFLAYMTDPMKVERESIGTYTLLYLFVFTMLSYLLYREFKKDLH